MPDTKNTRRDASSKSLKHHSCALCHRRKVKCDKKIPCSYCKIRGESCVPAPTPVPKPRKKRFPEAELLARLRRYETALKEYGADIDSINGTVNNADSRTSSSFKRDTDASPPTDLIPERPSTTKSRDNLNLSAAEDGMHEQGVQVSSDDEEEQCPILTTNYNSTGASDSTLLFNVGASVDLPNLHPPPVQIFRLWQVFLDNVHPLIKLFPASTVQQQLLWTASDPSNAPSAMHALLLTIYANAVVSMSDDACMAVMNEERWTLVSRYTTGAQYALHKSGFLQSSNLTVLQAFVLYLYSVMKVVDPRTFFSLTAIADRIAKRDGLHQNSQPRGMSAFDAEMRRRVWWQIVLLDTRAAEVSGAGTSTLGCGWNTKFPLNVSESELTPEAEVLPQGHEHATDMIFCLVRCEIAEFLRQIRAKANIEGRWSEFSNPCVSLLDKLAAIDAFEKHLQTTYLVHCDHRTTVHALARHYAIQSIAKMKIVAYGALSPRSRQDHPSVSDERHDRLMQVCIEAIEAYHQCVANRSLMRFAWFLAGNVPFLAYVHLLSDLRNRPKGDLVERAWEVVTSRNDVFGRPESLKGFGRRLLEAKDGTLQTAFAELVVRAWDARQAALGSESHIPVPPMVRKMRETLAATKGWSAEDAPIKTWVTQEKSDVKSVSVPTNGSIGNCPRSTSMYPNIIRLSKSGSSPRVEDPIPHTLNSTNMADMPSDRLPMHDELYELDYWQTLLPPESVEYAMDWDQALFSMYG